MYRPCFRPPQPTTVSTLKQSKLVIQSLSNSTPLPLLLIPPPTPRPPPMQVGSQKWNLHTSPTPLHYSRFKFLRPLHPFFRFLSSSKSGLVIILATAALSGMIYFVVQQLTTGDGLAKMDRKQLVLGAVFMMFLVLVLFVTMFGRVFLISSRAEAIATSLTMTQLRTKIRRAQIMFLIRVLTYLFAFLPFAGFLVTYFVFAEGTDKTTLRHGILLLPVGLLGVALSFGIVLFFLRPSSSIWKAGAIRAITSAYTRGHTEGISCVCVIKATSHTPHGEDLIFTSGREDGKIKVWSSETGRLLRSFMGHQKGVNHMSTNADQTKMYTARISSSDGGGETYYLTPPSLPY